MGEAGRNEGTIAGSVKWKERRAGKAGGRCVGSEGGKCRTGEKDSVGKEGRENGRGGRKREVGCLIPHTE
jgi:hypothetical protein